MDMTLESLLEGLEKQAGLVGMDKQASEDPKADEKHEKEEDKEESKVEKDVSEAKSDLEKSEKDFENLKKMNKEEEKKDEKEQTKEAQVAGAELAQTIMQKVASVQLSNKETQEMNKQASDAGKALADALLEKLANAGDVTTVNGIPEGVVPNKNQIDVAQTVAEQDAAIKPMPTGDGIKNTGTINQIFDAIVSDALGQGAATPTEIDHVSSSQAEGAVEASAVPNQEPVEKAAAVMSLVNSGIDFDSAVDMVKAAAEQIEAEEAEQVKQAAYDHLVGSGVDAALAAALVKTASAKEGHGKTVARGARAAGRSLVEGAVGAGAGAGVGAGVGALAAKAMKKAPGIGALAGAGLGAYTGNIAGGLHGLGRSVQNQMAEKRAAFNALCDAGMDFETAASLVQAKSQELYGA